MAWNEVVRKSSLNRWLHVQGFAADVVDAVRNSWLVAADVNRLKLLRGQASSSDGDLSQAQLRFFKPSSVRVQDGGLVNFETDGVPGGTPMGGRTKQWGIQQPNAKQGSANLEDARLRKELSQLRGALGINGKANPFCRTRPKQVFKSQITARIEPDYNQDRARVQPG